ncbi:aspartate aminotransferase family protein [Clostridium sp. Sa3CVN1]|uniref:Aspartate aminotransferase family protein n=2 Tax=Clostridiaceae TaxID=31979 RepID=A0ABR8PR41_9CLOT|nr:aspartate aminotransferase family protein [Clostridium cibarium]
MFRGDETSDLEFVKGEGIYLYDKEGNQYIDCEAGTFNLSLGYSNKEVNEAVSKQSEKLTHLTSSHMCKPVVNLAKNLVEISPENLTKVTTKVCGGSTANEGAIKLAQYYNKKTEIISFYRSHVGQTVFMQNVSGNSFRKKPFHFAQADIAHLQYPYCYRCHLNKKYPECNCQCVKEIEDYLNYGSTGSVSSLIIEPIQGNGGNQIPPKEYFQKLKKVCNENSIELIFDEIQTGMGRLGTMFAADYFNVSPNIMTVAKGLGGTGYQVAAILMEEKFNEMEAHFHSFTYGSNVLSCTAGNKTIEIIKRDGFLEHVKEAGNYIMEHLKVFKEKYEFIGDVRGVGLMIGIEVVKDKKSKEPDTQLTNAIVKKAFENKLLLRSSLYGFGNVFKIRPSLNITLEECEIMMNKLDKVLESFIL